MLSTYDGQTAFGQSVVGGDRARLPLLGFVLGGTMGVVAWGVVGSIVWLVLG